jgi:putative NADH-flavin reductase
MKVGFIGLGQMGLGMAASLLKAGHDVTVYNRTRSKADELVKKGAVAAKRIADVCAGDAVITMLANDAGVESVVYGDQGVRASLRKGAVHISSSTISVALCERLAVDHAAVGLRLASGVDIAGATSQSNDKSTMPPVIRNAPIARTTPKRSFMTKTPIKTPNSALHSRTADTGPMGR